MRRHRLRTSVRHVDQGLELRDFRRALDTDNLTIIRAAAAELPAINLEDALRVALLVCDHEPEHAERAALRWLGRFCLEQGDVTLAEVREALDAFASLVEDVESAEATLRRLARWGP